jgi:putative ABC transport system permease protein
MRFLDLIQLIAYNLNRRKGRVVMTAVGVVIGTASVVLLVSLASGLQKSATSSLGGIGDLTSITVYAEGGGGMVMMGPGGLDGKSSSGSDQEKILTDDVIQQISAIPGVKVVVPKDRFNGWAQITVNRMETYGDLIGLGIEDLAVLDVPVLQGSSEVQKGTVIFGGWAAKNFYDPNQRPGQEEQTQPDLLGQRARITLHKFTNDGQELVKNYDLTITGVLEETMSEYDYSIIVSMEDLTRWNEWNKGRRINRNRDGYNQVVVKVDDVDNVLEIAEQIDQMGFRTMTPQSFVKEINNVFVIVQLIFGGIGAISLIVAAIGIANTMTMAILERTREIGLMKAIGASNKDILSIFLGEAAGIGFIGGVIGALIGWIGGKAIDMIMLSFLAGQAAESGGNLPSSIVNTPPWLLLFAIVFSALIGLISGLYPSLRAATLTPVIALKYE